MTDTQAVYAARAQRAYAAMQRRFALRDGLYRRDGLLHPPGAASHLWPFARAFVATLDLAGVSAELLDGFDADAAIAQRLRALERYWDPGGDRPAYSSDVLGTRFGGDRYYDDNAWVGLALVQLERMRPDSGWLTGPVNCFGSPWPAGTSGPTCPVREACSGCSRAAEPGRQTTIATPSQTPPMPNWGSTSRS